MKYQAREENSMSRTYCTVSAILLNRNAVDRQKSMLDIKVGHFGVVLNKGFAR
jgi:hypothetical protein